MTPQAFSYGTLGPNGYIYLPPYGLTESLDYMIKLNPSTYEISKISLEVDDSFEKWQTGLVVDNKIYFLPHNESRLLILDTTDDSIEYVPINIDGNGKYLTGHVYDNKIYALPYGIDSIVDIVLIFDINTKILSFVSLDIPINDQKKWHTTQLINNIIYGVPRGERWTDNYFPYIIEFNCDTLEYKLKNINNVWEHLDRNPTNNKKFTTLAKGNNKLYAPPYSENPNFDILLKFIDGRWEYEHTGLTATSRKYYSHITATNGKIYFPPAGHSEEWSELLIIDTFDDTWQTVDLKIEKESKKYFTGHENSKNKLYFIPRGGCVCEPEEEWKQSGDLAEVLVIDTKDDTFYTIDVGNYFTDNTTIEKYNHSIIHNDIIFAFPYGESKSFQTVLVFDTISETVIKTIDLNEL